MPDRPLEHRRCFDLRVVVSARSAAGVLLVDSRGWVLLQLRDQLAPIGPGLWSTIAGSVEPGETGAAAAVRELAEETGLIGQRLELWFTGDLPANVGGGMTRWHVYAGRTDATDADLLVGEGADIRFVPPGDIPSLALVPSARLLLSDFLTSTAYARLVAGRLS